MNELEQKVKSVARRMVANVLQQSLLRCLFYGLCVVAAVAFADKLVHTGLSLPLFAYAVLAGCLPLAIVLTWMSGVTRLKAAVLADTNLGLKERLSSALAMKESGEAMAPALMEDALRHARRLDSARAVPLKLPREGRFLPIPVICAALAMLVMPSMDLLGRELRDAVRKQEADAIEREAKELKKKTEELKKFAKELKSENIKRVVEQMELAQEALKAKSMDRKTALVKMDELADDIQKQKDKLNSLKGTKQNLDKLEPFKSELAKALSEALKSGDMKQAAEEIKKLQEQLKNASADSDKVEQAARELEQLVKQLDPEKAKQLAEKLQKLAKALREAGMCGEDNQQAMDDASDALADVNDELKDIDQLLEELDMLEQALAQANKCKNGINGKDGDEEGKGLGDGRGQMPGIGLARPHAGMSKPGFGERPMGEKEPVDFEKVKAEIQLQKGKNLGDMVFTGQPPADAKASAEYTEVVGTAAKEAQEVLPKIELPLKRKEAVKKYFDSIEQPRDIPEEAVE